MKRRAREQGASEVEIAGLQKLAVEDTIKGLDINPVSLQLAASQLTAGNQEITYRRMGLRLMPYGPQPDNPAQVSAGTLELLGQKAIVSRDGELGLADDRIRSQSIWESDDTDLEDAVDAAKDARIAIMNPPFDRSKMGKKFPQETRRALRKRVDEIGRLLVRNDNDMEDFADENALGPLFVGLADRCLEASTGILTMVHPTIALTNPSGQHERIVLAQRFHIHTVLTCHQPGQINMSQDTSINESVIVLRRHDGSKPPTRFVNLDRFPIDEEVSDLHDCLLECRHGQIPNGWGEVSYWPAERVAEGDWTPAVWRSNALAQFSMRYANDPLLTAISDIERYTVRSSSQRLYENFERSDQASPNGIPVLDSKGAEGQTSINARPDSYWVPKRGRERQAEHYSRWASHLLVTAGQRNNTARLTATAGDTRYLGNGWSPVVGASPDDAKAIAVFINSTPGRIQLMRRPAKTLEFPQYKPEIIRGIRIPDLKDDRVRQILADCWERTKDTEVPQFRDGECEVRRLWDEAVAEAMGWDAAELSRLRHLLHQEPHVRGLGYGQYADEAGEEPANWADDSEDPEE